MRISDWSSDVCSSHLLGVLFRRDLHHRLDRGGSAGKIEHQLPLFHPPFVRAKHAPVDRHLQRVRSEEHTSELQSLMRISYAVFCLKKKTKSKKKTHKTTQNFKSHNTTTTTYNTPQNKRDTEIAVYYDN